MKIIKKITDHLKYCYEFWGGWPWLILVGGVIIIATVLAIIAP